MEVFKNFNGYNTEDACRAWKDPNLFMYWIVCVLFDFILFH